MTVSALLPGHWQAVRTIYEEGIATGDATFQTGAPSWEDWDRSHLTHSRLVAISDGHVVGWAALTPVSSRCVYSGVAEVSIYIAADSRGKKVGAALLRMLVEESERNNIWTLQAGIFPENAASVRLHEVTGFRMVGVREKIGKMGDRWRDYHLYERRSHVAGV